MNWAGYQKLRKGRIHLFCVRCKRKMSNMYRHDYDPPRAELVQTWCERCASGGKDMMEWFLDRNGREISYEEIERHITRLVKAQHDPTQ